MYTYFRIFLVDCLNIIVLRSIGCRDPGDISQGGREEGGREGGVTSGTDQAALNLHENKKRRAVAATASDTS